jgi:hypothetical protein
MAGGEKRMIRIGFRQFIYQKIVKNYILIDENVYLSKKFDEPVSVANHNS